MMCEVEIGKIYIPLEVKEAVENHRKKMIENNADMEFLKTANFNLFFADYLYKFGYKMVEG